PENSERPRVDNIINPADLHREILKERWLVDIIAFFVPLINLAGSRRDFVPLGILIGEISIQSSKHFRLERGPHGVANFCERRPDIAQIDVTIVPFADWLLA